MSSEIAIRKVFVASPSDTEQERKCVDSVVREFNQSLGDHFKLKFETIKWETHANPQMGRPQGVINNQLKIDMCDLFIGILWLKFGSPSGTNEDGVSFSSGSEEEFYIAYHSWKKSKKPYIMMFRSTKNARSTINIDLEQLKKVNAFIEEFSCDKSHPGLYREFKSSREFEKVLRSALIQYAIDDVEKRLEKKSLLHPLKKYGIEDIFVPELNSIRNESKKKSIQEPGNIFLIAHSCYSFIAQFGHRYRDLIEEKLKSGYCFKAVASNPWSESSFFASFSEVYENLRDYEYVGDDGKRYLDSIRIIEDSRCYSMKYRDSINGYLNLRKKYRNQIQLRFTKYEIMSSILLTDKDCYMEPYLPVNLDERYEKGMLTFELRISNTSYLYRHNKKYFDFLWNLSEDYESYVTHIEEYQKRLLDKTLMEVE